MLDNRDGEGAAGYRSVYLPRNTKLVVREDVSVLIPPVNYQGNAEKITLPKGTVATLLNSDPICVGTDHGLRVGLLVRVDDIPEEKCDARSERLIERKVAVPVEALDIHPDAL